MPIRGLTFSPDSQLLLTASDDGHIKMYDSAQGSLVSTFYGHSSWVLSVAFSPNGQHFASGYVQVQKVVWIFSI